MTAIIKCTAQHCGKGRRKKKTTELYILNRDSHWDITLNNYKSWKCFLFFSIHFPCLLEWKRKHVFMVSFHCTLFPAPYETQNPCAVVTNTTCHVIYQCQHINPPRQQFKCQAPSDKAWEERRTGCQTLKASCLFLLNTEDKTMRAPPCLAVPSNKIWARISQLALNIAAKLIPRGWGCHSRAGLQPCRTLESCLSSLTWSQLQTGNQYSCLCLLV